MSMSEGSSLLTFVDAPLLVGDPEGRVIYVNPAFESRFDRNGGEVQGELLASLFSGGAREAMLGAVARVCQTGETERFRLREGHEGFLALVSAIRGTSEQLGVVILLTDEPLADERVMVFHREMREPLEDLHACLEGLLEETGGRRAEVFRESVESGLHALERAQKWCDELHAVLIGRAEAPPPAAHQVDPVCLLRDVAVRVERELANRAVELDLLVPGRLSQVQGDASKIETALVHLIRSRAEEARPGGRFTLSARQAGSDERGCVLISLVDPKVEDAERIEWIDVPNIVANTLAPLGGRVHTTGSPRTGWVICLALEVGG